VGHFDGELKAFVGTPEGFALSANSFHTKTVIMNRHILLYDDDMMGKKRTFFHQQGFRAQRNNIIKCIHLFEDVIVDCTQLYL